MPGIRTGEIAAMVWKSSFCDGKMQGSSSEGFVLGAFYWQPGWTDCTKIIYWTDPPVPIRNLNMLRYCGYEAQLDGARNPDLLSESIM
jgi:hypothetical protein